MASTYLTRTFNTPTNRKIWTWSAWVKRQNLVSDHTNALFGAYYDTNNRSVLRFNAHQLNFQDTANSVEIKTNRLFRDTSAWYHIVARVDTTQSTASDRVRLYVNGEQETSFATATYPAQNDNMQFNGADPHYINARNSSGSVDSIADMSYSHVHFADGQSLAPTVFGSTDSTTGEWKINTNPSFTLGTNGFTILKDGNTYTDQSSNSNNWSLGAGILTKTEDNPSNVFATMNPLSTNDANGNFTNGNTSTNTGASAWRTMFSTMGNSTGKYYCEMKWVSGSNMMFGVFSLDEKNKIKNVGYVGDNTLGNRAVGLAQGGDYYINGSTSTYPGGSNTSWAIGDIIQIALDKDNNKVYFGKNGTWMGSGDPTSGSTGTGAISFSTEGYESWGFATSCYASTAAQNFGNGYFGTTAVASAGTNASGNGIFEYDVPTGYTALSTKGLNL